MVVERSYAYDALPSTEQLARSEEKALSVFFGKEIGVPNPPAELFQTLENLIELGISKIEPHYLAQIALRENDRFPGWKVKPEPWFWEQITNSNIAEDSATLKEGWYLVDGRAKPDYQDGRQMYKDDYLVPIMQELRTTGKIQKDTYLPDNSRFVASPEEIEGIILPEFAKFIKTKGQVINMREIEFNIWGNMFHPEWGRTSTTELFADKFEDVGRLNGGSSIVGGLAHVYHEPSHERGGGYGFRPLIVFSSKT